MVQKIKFQWYFDFSTSADSMQLITVKAGGSQVFERLKPFFAAYKRYRLGSVKCTFVPASTLPVDPTGLSYEGGENTVDPRDQLNMGLTRITNGEDFFDDISKIPVSRQQALYDAMLMDPRWYKWSLQSGLKRKAYPKYWQIGQLHQDYFPGATVNVPHIPEYTTKRVDGTDARYQVASSDEDYFGQGELNYTRKGYSDPRGLFQTGHKGRLGWMPTDALIQYVTQNGTSEAPEVAAIPTIEMFKIVTPKAHKTIYYYRVYVTEEVYFAQPITTIGLANSAVSGSSFVGMLDRFLIGEARTVTPEFGGSSTPDMNPPNDGSENDEVRN